MTIRLRTLCTVAGTVGLVLWATTAAVADPLFPQAPTYGVGDSPRAVAIADLDGDGDADLAVPNYMDDNVSILLNQSRGCDGNDIPDECDIARGISRDCQGNGIPDECELCGDLDDDQDVDYADYVIFASAMGGVTDGDPPEDWCCDYSDTGTVNLVDYQMWLMCYRDFIGDPLAGPPTPPELRPRRRSARPDETRVLNPPADGQWERSRDDLRK